jgi:predicted DNA-binding ribbon-helix-helix protein
MARSRRKKETYRDKWLKEHPRVSLYLEREKYEMIRSMAESKNMSIKEFILSLIDGFDKYHGDIKAET